MDARPDETRPNHLPHRIRLAMALAGLLLGAFVAVGCAADPTHEGSISDDQIDLEVTAQRGTFWLELKNAGSRPCDLIVVNTYDEADANIDPTRLPVTKGRVDTWTALPDRRSTDTVYGSAELYAEVDGTVLPLIVDAGEDDPPGRVRIESGAMARIQLAQATTPRAGALEVLICDNPGDYERGRYAVIRRG